ncbi:hypothetical protein M3Y95_00512000 [Aphelenchoides besseyi]|nr:hypothetical protein M3Y95_00512000 [Aphelenchoides besseyi]
MPTHQLLFGFICLLANQLAAQPSTLQQLEWDRFRRQTLPVEHLQIHSTQSNITINDKIIRAISAESIINLDKEPYNATLFSRQSDTQFDSNATFVQINAVALDFALAFQQMVFRSMADTGDVEMRLNPQQMNQSVLRLRLADNVHFGVSDEKSLLRIISSNATQVVFSASTEQQILPRQLQLGYDNTSDVFRILFAENQARVSVEITRSIIHLNYGNIFIQMDNNYRRLIILTSGHRLEFHTLGSRFQIQFNADRMAISYPNDNVTVHAGSASNNVTIDVMNFSKMDIHRTNESSISVQGSTFTNDSVENIDVVSKQLELSLQADNDSLILATTNQSRLSLNTTTAQVLLASNSHQIEVLGNKPFLMATTENVALVITSTSEQEMRIPNISVPNIDYSKYNLQNLTQLDTIASNTTWFTSKIDINNLIGEEITPIDGFSSVLGAASILSNITSRPLTSTVANTLQTTLAPLMPITFPPAIEPQASTTMPEIPTDFPTPPPIENAIAETGFPIPPLVTNPNEGQQVVASSEVPMMITPAVQSDGQNDNFIIGQFESATGNSFPLSATIVNVSFIPTTPMPV